MDEIKEMISVLKDKILNEIETFNHYKELKYTKEVLLQELNSFEYDENDLKSLKTYYGWLNAFYLGRIKFIDNRIIERKQTVFDNSEEDQIEKVKELENIIQEKVDYITKHYSNSEIISEYYSKLKKYYKEELDIIISNTKRNFNNDIGIKEGATLSLYKDAKSLRQAYIHQLESFIQSCTSVTIFIEKDEEIRKIFKDAYDAITDSEVIDAMKEIENNYYDSIKKSITGDLTIISPEQIQIEMNEVCEKIKELTNYEITKNKYHNIINEITFNTDNEKILEVLNYVMNNHLFEDEFYNILFAIIEKEKYLLYKFNCKPSIYPKLNDKIKNYIERIFINRLGDDEMATESINNLKKYGYLKVLDRKYQELFDNHKFTSHQIINLKESNCYAKRFDDSVAEMVISDQKGVHEDGKTAPGDIFYQFRKVYGFNSNADYVQIRFDRTFNKNYIIDSKNGKKYHIPDSMINIIAYKNGTFLVTNKKNRITLYNNDLKKVNEINIDILSESYYIDYGEKKLLVQGKNHDINIYDLELNLIKTIDNSEINAGFLLMANDGVISVSIAGGILYYDYINEKAITSFARSKESDEYIFAYSEGLLNSVDKNGLYGYKDISGNIQIEPKFKLAMPFLGNLARVREDDDFGMIDRTGKFTSKKDLFKKLEKNIDENSQDYLWDSYCYLFTLGVNYQVSEFLECGNIYPNFADHNYSIREIYNVRDSDKYFEDSHYRSGNIYRGYLLATDNYTLDLDIPIKDIEMDKGKTKKKQ